MTESCMFCNDQAQGCLRFFYEEFDALCKPHHKSRTWKFDV